MGKFEAVEESMLQEARSVICSGLPKCTSVVLRCELWERYGTRKAFFFVLSPNLHWGVLHVPFALKCAPTAEPLFSVLRSWSVQRKRRQFFQEMEWIRGDEEKA